MHEALPGDGVVVGAAGVALLPAAEEVLQRLEVRVGLGLVAEVDELLDLQGGLEGVEEAMARLQGELRLSAPLADEGANGSVDVGAGELEVGGVGEDASNLGGERRLKGKLKE